MKRAPIFSIDSLVINFQSSSPRIEAIGATLSAFEASPGKSSGIPPIGSYWEGQGGIYAGVMRGEDGGRDYHLIFPNHPSVLNHKAAYGGYEVDEPGAVSLRDGLANTRALVDSDTEHPAAEWCCGLVVEGHNDLYLPALHEYALGMANVPEIFTKEWHVSSSQRSASIAYTMHFDGGIQLSGTKGLERFVRPARRFIR
jgi:hypothetical protein